jgi:hypothetical protein
METDGRIVLTGTPEDMKVIHDSFCKTKPKKPWIRRVVAILNLSRLEKKTRTESILFMAGVQYTLHLISAGRLEGVNLTEEVKQRAREEQERQSYESWREEKESDE